MINYTENGSQLHEAIRAAGHTLVEHNGQWIADDEQAVQAIIDGYDRRAAALTEKWEAIKAERDRRTLHGGYRVGDKWFHSDVFSRSQQIGMVMLGNNLPAGLQWKTMDGSFVAMTPTLAHQVFGAAAASDAAIFGAAEAKRASLEASAAPWDYDVMAGWPPMFGE